jgi:hypothetical protein
MKLARRFSASAEAIPQRSRGGFSTYFKHRLAKYPETILSCPYLSGIILLTENFCCGRCWLALCFGSPEMEICAQSSGCYFELPISLDIRIL